MSEDQKATTGRFHAALSPLVLEALRARGLSDEAIKAIIQKRRKPKA